MIQLGCGIRLGEQMTKLSWVINKLKISHMIVIIYTSTLVSCDTIAFEGGRSADIDQIASEKTANQYHGERHEFKTEALRINGPP